MSNKILILLISVIIILALGLFLYNPSEKPETGEETAPTGNQAAFSFRNPKKSAHYESNTPAHGAVLAAAPLNAVIDVNFDLVPPSSISITGGGKEYGIGDTKIDSNKLAMRRAMDSQAPDGLYTVRYKGCWPDKSCHDGHFEFAIDRTLSSSFTDFRNQKEVNIKLSNIVFAPAEILISKGTKIIWQNDDSVEHYVNTDAHPSHTYFPAQNSRELKQGDTYSFVFDTPGVYPYHCSAHAGVMTATIIVE